MLVKACIEFVLFEQISIKKKTIMSGVLGDKTMDDKLIYIPNDDKKYFPFCRLKLLVISLNTIGLNPSNQN